MPLGPSGNRPCSSPSPDHFWLHQHHTHLRDSIPRTRYPRPPCTVPSKDQVPVMSRSEAREAPRSREDRMSDWEPRTNALPIFTPWYKDLCDEFKMTVITSMDGDALRSHILGRPQDQHKTCPASSKHNPSRSLVMVTAGPPSLILRERLSR